MNNQNTQKPPEVAVVPSLVKAKPQPVATDAIPEPAKGDGTITGPKEKLS